MSRVSRYFSIAAVLPVLAACAAYERADEAAKAKQALIGMDKAEVLYCAGPPHRREAHGEDEIWIYRSADGEKIRRGPDRDAAGTGGLGIPTRPEVIPERYCVVRMTMNGGRVADVRYTGMTGGMFSKGEQCAFILSDCVP